MQLKKWFVSLLAVAVGSVAFALPAEETQVTPAQQKAQLAFATAVQTFNAHEQYNQFNEVEEQIIQILNSEKFGDMIMKTAENIEEQFPNLNEEEKMGKFVEALIANEQIEQVAQLFAQNQNMFPQSELDMPTMKQGVIVFIFALASMGD